MTDFLYPVVDTINRVKVASSANYTPANHSVVAVLGGSLYWRSLIQKILPQGSNGIHVVFSNPCTASFTYQVNGPTVQYLGVGDKHETKYDGCEVHGRLDALGYNTKSNSAYSGAPIDDEYCPMTLHVYPSDEMKASFTTQNPLVLSIAVLFIFGFVSLIFFWYDRKVE
jgi:hypothetical protein